MLRVEDIQAIPQPADGLVNTIASYVQRIKDNAIDLTEISLPGMGLSTDQIVPLINALFENPEAACRITRLDLSHNKIQYLDLYPLSGLQQLNISNNKLAEIDMTFLPCLETALLNNNQLETISFHVNNVIQTLDTSNNKIKAINAADLTAAIGRRENPDELSGTATKLELKVSDAELQNINFSYLQQIHNENNINIISQNAAEIADNVIYHKQISFKNGNSCLLGYFNKQLSIISEDPIDVTISGAIGLTNIIVKTKGKVLFSERNSTQSLRIFAKDFAQASGASLKVSDKKVLIVKNINNSKVNEYIFTSLKNSVVECKNIALDGDCKLDNFAFVADKIITKEDSNISGHNCRFESVKPTSQVEISGEGAGTNIDQNLTEYVVDINGKSNIDRLGVMAENLNVYSTGGLCSTSSIQLQVKQKLWNSGRIDGHSVSFKGKYIMLMRFGYLFSQTPINLSSVCLFIAAGAVLRAPVVQGRNGCYLNVGGIVCAYDFSVNSLFENDTLGFNLPWRPGSVRDLFSPAKLLNLATRVGGSYAKPIQPLLGVGSMACSAGSAIQPLLVNGSMACKTALSDPINTGKSFYNSGKNVCNTVLSATHSLGTACTSAVSAVKEANKLSLPHDVLKSLNKSIADTWNAADVEKFVHFALEVNGYKKSLDGMLSNLTQTASLANQARSVDYNAMYNNLSLDNAKAFASQKAKDLYDTVPGRENIMQGVGSALQNKVQKVVDDAVKPITAVADLVTDPLNLPAKAYNKASAIKETFLENTTNALYGQHVKNLTDLYNESNKLYYGAGLLVEPVPVPSVTTEPAKIEPAKIEPVTTEPVTTEPVTTEPVTTEPAKTDTDNRYKFEDLLVDTFAVFGSSVYRNSVVSLNAGFTIAGSTVQESSFYAYGGMTFALNSAENCTYFYNSGEHYNYHHSLTANGYSGSGNINAVKYQINVQNYNVDKHATLDAHAGVTGNIRNLRVQGKNNINGGNIFVLEDNIVESTGQQTVNDGVLHVNGNNVLHDGAKQGLNNGVFVVKGTSFISSGATQNVEKMKLFNVNKEVVHGARNVLDSNNMRVEISEVSKGAQYVMDNSVQSGAKISFEQGSDVNLKNTTLKDYELIQNNTDMQLENTLLSSKLFENFGKIGYKGNLTLWAEDANFKKDSMLEHIPDSQPRVPAARPEDKPRCVIDADRAQLDGGMKVDKIDFLISEMPAAEMQALVDGEGKYAAIQVDSEIRGVTESTDKIIVHTYAGDIKRPRGNNVQTYLQTNGIVSEARHTRERNKEWTRLSYKETDGKRGVVNGREGYAAAGIEYDQRRKNHGVMKVFNSRKAFSILTTVAGTTAALFSQANPLIASGAAVVAAGSDMMARKIREKENDAARQEALKQLENSKQQAEKELSKQAKKSMKENYLNYGPAGVPDASVMAAIMRGDVLGAINQNYLPDSDYAKNLAGIHNEFANAQQQVQQDVNAIRQEIDQAHQERRNQIRMMQNTKFGLAASANAGPTGVDLNVGTQTTFQGKNYTALTQVANIETPRIKIDTTAKAKKEYEEEMARRQQAEAEGNVLPRGYTGPEYIEIQTEPAAAMAKTRHIPDDIDQQWPWSSHLETIEEGEDYSCGEEEKVSEPFKSQAHGVTFEQLDDNNEPNNNVTFFPKIGPGTIKQDLNNDFMAHLKDDAILYRDFLGKPYVKNHAVIPLFDNLSRIDRAKYLAGGLAGVTSEFLNMAYDAAKIFAELLPVANDPAAFVALSNKAADALSDVGKNGLMPIYRAYVSNIKGKLNQSDQYMQNGNYFSAGYNKFGAYTGLGLDASMLMQFGVGFARVGMRANKFVFSAREVYAHRAVGAGVNIAAVSELSAKLASSGELVLKLRSDLLVRTHPLSGKRSAAKVKSLEKDIRLNGFNINQPIEVVAHNGKFYILDGQHRYRAAIMSGIKDIPVKIITDIKNHPSSWNTIEEVLEGAAQCGHDHLKFRY